MRKVPRRPDGFGSRCAGWRHLSAVLPLLMVAGCGRPHVRDGFKPITRAHLAETVRLRFEALRDEFRRSPPQPDTKRAPSLVAVTALHAALHWKVSGDPRAAELLDQAMSYALAELWNGQVLIDWHHYIDNAVWASLVGAALLEVGDAAKPQTRKAMELTVRGAATVLRNRATGHAPTNVFVSNQDAMAASGLLRAFQCFGDEAFRDAARSKFLAILERQQQGLWSEHGVGPLYQGVGLGFFSEVAAALFDELTYEQRLAVMEVTMEPCFILTSPTSGGYQLGLEAARSRGFRGPCGLSSYCVDVALRQRNPFLLRGVHSAYPGLRQVKWPWGLHDGVTAHLLYRLYRRGGIPGGGTDSWRIAWGAKARIVTLKVSAFCDEQSYVRSPRGLVAHFADRRLSVDSTRRDVQHNPGGLRYLARGHEVVVAPDVLSRPRFLIGTQAPQETDYIGSRVRRGVYASQYELLQRLRDEAGEPAGDVRQTFCAVGDWLIVRTRSRSRASEYSITHPDSEDETLAGGKAVLSRLKRSVGKGKPCAHACFSLDGMAVRARDSDLPPFPGTAVEMPLDEWVVPFPETQMRYIAVQAGASAEGIEGLVAGVRPAQSINGKALDPRDTNRPYAVALTTQQGTCYVVFGNHSFAAEVMTVTFPEHEFRLVDTDRQAVSVFGFDQDGRLEGFAASARRLSVDGREMFRAPGTAYVSCVMPRGQRAYASADGGPATLCFPLRSCRSLVTGDRAKCPRLRTGEIVTYLSFGE